MEIACMFALACFGLFAGFFAGSGNRQGIVVALIVGVITGGLLDLPFIKDGNLLSLCVLFASAVVGSVAALFAPDNKGLKLWARRRQDLRIRCGKYYQLGGE